MSAPLPRPLIAGIDTLEIGYCINEYKLSQDEWEMIDSAKEVTQSTRFAKSQGVIFRGVELNVHRAGKQRHKYILSNGDIQLDISPEATGGRDYPEIKVTFRSELLWRHGWQDAVRKVDSFIRDWAVVSEIKLSRIDITGDFATPFPVLSPGLREVVTRAKKKGERGDLKTEYQQYSDTRMTNTYSFGSGAVQLRIYNKTLEIKSSNKQWFEHLWSDCGWKKGEPVTRLEFQARRKIIRQMQIETLEDLFLQVPDLWRYLTHEWLTIREPRDDSRRTRWPVSEFWRAVQQAGTTFGECTGVSRLKQMRPRFNRQERLARGVLISMAALSSKSLARGDAAYGKMVVKRMVEKWMADPSFEEEIEKRRSRFSSMEY